MHDMTCAVIGANLCCGPGAKIYISSAQKLDTQNFHDCQPIAS